MPGVRRTGADDLLQQLPTGGRSEPGVGRTCVDARRASRPAHSTTPGAWSRRSRQVEAHSGFQRKILSLSWSWTSAGRVDEGHHRVRVGQGGHARLTLAPAGLFRVLSLARDGRPPWNPTRWTAHFPATFQISKDTAGRSSRRSARKGGGAHSFRRSVVSRKGPTDRRTAGRDLARGGSDDDCHAGS